jgi:hypothetical protein
MSRRPYRQGELDGLCGVYALVNAVDYLCGPLSKRKAKKLFSQILTHLESKAPLATRCSSGISINEIGGILKYVICEEYPIRRYKPFHLKPSISHAAYIQTLERFLQQPNTIVFLILYGRFNHWTLIHHITDKTLVTYDSSEIHYVLRSSCSMIDDKVQKLHWLIPTHTYFLKLL